jgi:hypothetical protein
LLRLLHGARREALRSQFLTLTISREAAHAFAHTPRSGWVLKKEAATDTTPFGALRAAQLQALGIEPRVAAVVAPLLLPPQPCADADAEFFLLDAVRFFASQNAFGSKVDGIEAALMRDLGFFLDSQLRAAQQRGQPPHEAFSFAGRTLASVTRLAVQRRRDALVDAAAAAVAAGATREAVLKAYRRGEHRETSGGLSGWQLTWDGACDDMFEARVCHQISPSGLPERWWKAAPELMLRDGLSWPLRGHWHMRQLSSTDDVAHEGKAQHNCLARGGAYYLSRGSLWSLRFTPDADALLPPQAEHARLVKRHVKELRLTVYLHHGRIETAMAAANRRACHAARVALASWARRAAVPHSLGIPAEAIDQEEGQHACG